MEELNGRGMRRGATKSELLFENRLDWASESRKRRSVTDSR